MSIKLVLLNGPKRTGKDTAYQALTKKDHTLKPFMMVERFSYADIIRGATHNLLGLRVRLNYYDGEDKKDKINKDFLGLTPRQAYIEVGQAMRKIFGKDVFNRTIASDITNFHKATKGEGLSIVTDCGFQVELDYLCKEFGNENVLLIKLMRSGGDYTFKDDIREYVVSDGCKSVFIANDSTIENFNENITEEVKIWLKSR